VVVKVEVKPAFGVKLERMVGTKGRLYVAEVQVRKVVVDLAKRRRNVDGSEDINALQVFLPVYSDKK
jgi:hypothetical protein